MPVLCVPHIVRVCDVICCSLFIAYLREIQRHQTMVAPNDRYGENMTTSLMGYISWIMFVLSCRFAPLWPTFAPPAHCYQRSPKDLVHLTDQPTHIYSDIPHQKTKMLGWLCYRITNEDNDKISIRRGRKCIFHRLIIHAVCIMGKNGQAKDCSVSGSRQPEAICHILHVHRGTE